MEENKKKYGRKFLSIFTAATISFSSIAPLTQYVVSASSSENKTELIEEESKTETVLEKIEDLEKKETNGEEKKVTETEEKATSETEEKAASETEEKAASETEEKAASETEEKAVSETEEKAASETEEKAASETEEKTASEIEEKLSAKEKEKANEIVEYIDSLPSIEKVNLSNSRIPSKHIRGEYDALSDAAKQHVTNLEKLEAIEEKVETLMSTVVKEPAPATEDGSKAYDHIKYLSEELGGDRVSGSDYEVKAANYIKAEFESYNYDTKLVPFTFEGKRGNQKGKQIDSQNVIAVKEGTSGKQVILGAHYDQVIDGGSKGASDNASGVGAMLEVAENLQDIETKHTIIFVSFGSEEVGLEGSNAYVKMDNFEAENVLGMINLDTVLAGDYAYVYGGTNGKGSIRDNALNISNELDLDLVTQEGEVEGHKYGETGDWSDHAPFNELGIPVAYFESTSWKIRDKNNELMDGYTETGKGSIMHSGNDTLEYINKNFPGRAKKRLNTFVRVLEPLMKDMAVVVNAEDELDQDELDSVIQEVIDLAKDKYTSESWKSLENALNMKESTQEEIDAKVKAIKKALSKLVLMKDEGNGSDDSGSGSDGSENGSDGSDGSDGSENGSDKNDKLPQTGEANYQGKILGIVVVLTGAISLAGLHYKKEKNI